MHTFTDTNKSFMQENKVRHYIKKVLENMPNNWLGLTTHRLDIYEEKLAKTQFINQLETLYQKATVMLLH